MGGGGKSISAPAPAPVVSDNSIIDEEADKKTAELAERERRRKAAIAASGRASAILAGNEAGTWQTPKLLGE